MARLADEAILHPQNDPADPASATSAAFHGGLDVVLVRGFGHDNFNTQPPWSVRWIGAVPPGTSGPSCYDAGRPVPTGTFVEGEGGCAVLYYDTADPTAHDAELASWLADPTTLPGFKGEVITVRWVEGGWEGVGSAE
jgi:hypothetical protein